MEDENARYFLNPFYEELKGNVKVEEKEENIARETFKNIREDFQEDFQEEWKCCICRNSFSSFDDLQTHVQIQHKKRTLRRREDRVVKMVEVHLPKKHPCIMCKKLFMSAFSLEKHMLIRHKKRRKQDQMVNTKDIHLPKKHPCTVCKKLFVAASSLERHILTHSGKRPFECKQCQWSFTQPAHLKRHTASIHTGDLKLHNCLDCKKSFKSNYHLKRHMLVHSREKPYKCTSCSHSSTTAQSLDFHVHRRKAVQVFSMQYVLQATDACK